MKRRLKAVIVILIIVLVSYLYAHIDVTHDIYGSDVDISAAANNVTLLTDTIQQDFISQENTLHGVTIKSTVRSRVEAISFAFTVDHLETGERVAQGSAFTEHPRDGGFFEFHFDAIEHADGQKYRFTAYVEHVDNETQDIDQDLVGFLYDRETAEDTSFIVNEEGRQGTLILRTSTRRFDLTTFIVVAAFLSYIVLFMKFLYKLFK